MTRATSLSPHLAIAAREIGKRYLLGDTSARANSIRDALSGLVRAPFSRFKRLAGKRTQDEILWALREASFEIETGEVVGIVGRNGSGKSTLLKILARVTAPTEGRVSLRGRVGSLLEVGTGFHADLTARENIFLNGALLGMRRAEISAQLDAIIAFSEIDRFIDTPVKRFSTGMYIRLGFAVAAHIRSDILLVDEVLAVGDAAFQRKCLSKMGALAAEGRTVLFVSHNMATVKKLCPRAIWLEEGRIIADGTTSDVVERYLTHGDAQPDESTVCTFDPAPKNASAAILVGGCAPANASFDGARAFFSCSVERELDIWTRVDVSQNDTGISLLLRIYDVEGNCVLTSEDTDGGTTPLASEEVGTHDVRARLPAHLLAPGNYRVELALWSLAGGFIHAPKATLAFELRDSGTWRTARAPFRGGGIIAPTLDFDVVSTGARGEVRE